MRAPLRAAIEFPSPGPLGFPRAPQAAAEGAKVAVLPEVHAQLIYEAAGPIKPRSHCRAIASVIYPHSARDLALARCTFGVAKETAPSHERHRLPREGGALPVS